MKYLLALFIIVTNTYAQDNSQIINILKSENTCGADQKRIVHTMKIKNIGLSATPHVAKTYEGDFVLAYKNQKNEGVLELHLCARKDKIAALKISNSTFQINANKNCNVNDLNMNAMLSAKKGNYFLAFHPVQMKDTNNRSALCTNNLVAAN